MDCKCQVVFDEPQFIDYCPLHAAAGEMLEALRLVMRWRKGQEGPEILFKEGATMTMAVKTAIAKAEPKGNKDDTTR